MSDLNHRFPRQASRRWGAQASDEKRRSAEYAPGQADRCSVAKSGTRVLWLALSAEEEDVKGSPARETCFFRGGKPQNSASQVCKPCLQRRRIRIPRARRAIPQQSPSP